MYIQILKIEKNLGALKSKLFCAFFFLSLRFCSFLVIYKDWKFSILYDAIINDVERVFLMEINHFLSVIINILFYSIL